LGFALSITLFSCTKDEVVSSDVTSAKSIVSTNNRIDNASNDISDIADNQMVLMDLASAKSSDIPESYLSNCVTSEYSHPTDYTWTRMLTFTNCTLPNGNTIKGTISMTIVKNPETHIFTITHTFTNFYHNSTKVEGTRTVVKTLISTDSIPHLHPVAEITMNMHFTTPDGVVHHHEGSKRREMIDGFMTPKIWSDDVFSITGSWTNSSLEGICTATIKEPLILKMNKDCRGIVKGTIEFVKGDKTAVLNYGDGTCDHLATITIGDKTETITIGKK
jgi:hypothetical protein